jgi:hypothetical protein
VVEYFGGELAPILVERLFAIFRAGDADQGVDEQAATTHLVAELDDFDVGSRGVLRSILKLGESRFAG